MSTPQDKAKKGEDKRKRLGEALRENLKRRKSQSRGRKHAATTNERKKTTNQN